MQEIDATTTKQYLHSTNHAHLPEIVEIEPLAMEHSVCRYEFIKTYMEQAKQLTDKDLKELLLSEYPRGLCCHWYDEFFGTIKSMVFDVTLGKVDICWGGIGANGWKTYSLDTDMQVENLMVDIEVKHPTFNFNRLV